MAKKDLSAFLNKAKETSTVKTPKQKVVPVKDKKRDNETQFSLWVDNDLLKKYKQKALDENTNVKELIVKLMANNL